MDPYKNCPVLESDTYRLRLVEKDDAEDLLACYGDKTAVQNFNNDNCPADFYHTTVDSLEDLIEFWLWEYSNGGYVRFAIVDKANNKAIGTVEFFVKVDTYRSYGKIGVLRLDLAASYENVECLTDLLRLIENHFTQLFNMTAVMTKANPLAETRIKALESMDYMPLHDKEITFYEDYYIKKIKHL